MRPREPLAMTDRFPTFIVLKMRRRKWTWCVRTIEGIAIMQGSEATEPRALRQKHPAGSLRRHAREMLGIGYLDELTSAEFLDASRRGACAHDRVERTDHDARHEAQSTD